LTCEWSDIGSSPRPGPSARRAFGSSNSGQRQRLHPGERHSTTTPEPPAPERPAFSRGNESAAAARFIPTTTTSHSLALHHILVCPNTASLYPHLNHDRPMPGIIYSPRASSVGAVAGMKRAHAAESVPTYGRPHPKKQKIAHHLHHTQPVQHIADPISAEIGDFGDSKDFFDQQLRRAIAIQCRTMGFESARPDALEEFRGLVDSCTASRVAQCAHICRPC
jgi:hypothetical protein